MSLKSQRNIFRQTIVHTDGRTACAKFSHVTQKLGVNAENPAGYNLDIVS